MCIFNFIFDLEKNAQEIKYTSMKKVLVLICYHLGLWGILGFFATLILGFIACCTNLSEVIFYVLLGIFAVIGVSATTYCISKSCTKSDFKIHLKGDV